jgi:hypothetical protein
MNETRHPAENLVALDRYPINALASKSGKSFLDRCQTELATNGYCNLKGFLRPQAVSSLISESDAWEAIALSSPWRRQRRTRWRCRG